MTRPVAVALILVVGLLAGSAHGQKKPKLKPTVTFAQTWDDAVAEAKMLNVPIVVHSHGFY